MRKDADANAEGDKKRRALADIKNQASSLVFQTEKSVKEFGDKLDDAAKSAIEASIKKVTEAAEGDDAERIKSAIEDLQQAAQAFAALYQQAGDQGGAEPETAGATAGGGDDDVIDAEFEKK